MGSLALDSIFLFFFKEDTVNESSHRALGRGLSGAALCVRWEEDVSRAAGGIVFLAAIH